MPVEGNPSPTGQIQSDSAVRSSRDRAGGPRRQRWVRFWEYNPHVVCCRDLGVEDFGAHQESCPQAGCDVRGVLAAGSSRVFGHRATRLSLKLLFLIFSLASSALRDPRA